MLAGLPASTSDGEWARTPRTCSSGRFILRRRTTLNLTLWLHKAQDIGIQQVVSWWKQVWFEFHVQIWHEGCQGKSLAAGKVSNIIFRKVKLRKHQPQSTKDNTSSSLMTFYHHSIYFNIHHVISPSLYFQPFNASTFRVSKGATLRWSPPSAAPNSTAPPELEALEALCAAATASRVLELKFAGEMSWGFCWFFKVL